MDNNQNNFEQNFTEPVVPLEPEVKKPLLAVQDPLFLVMCVLISVSIAFSFNIFNLLLVIGMWIAFANAKSNGSILSGAKLCAGTMKANYIVWWVVIGMIYLLGVIVILLALVAPLGFTNTYFIDSFLEIDGVGEAFESLVLSGLAYEVLYVMLLVISGITLLILATIFLFLNIFFNKNVYKFAYSLRDNISSGAPIVKAKTVSAWLMVLAIIQGLGVFGTLFDFESVAAVGTMLATYIIAYIWIKKYFIEQ